MLIFFKLNIGLFLRSETKWCTVKLESFANTMTRFCNFSFIVFSRLACLRIFVFYIAPNFVWREVLFNSCESVILFVCLFVILFVCLWLCDQDNSKSSRPIFMTFRRKLSYYKMKVKFEYEKKTRFGRTQTASKRNLKNAISQKVSNRYQSNRAGRSVLVK